MSELLLLRVLLLLSIIIAPLGTRAWVQPPRVWVRAYVAAVIAVALGLFLPVAALCVLWVCFCIVNAIVLLGPSMRGGDRVQNLRTPGTLVMFVPLVFSFIAATWLVGGANDLRILGYGPFFSYYAALHGNVLGWGFVGAIAASAKRAGPHRRTYLALVFVCLASFLMIAFGIDGLAVIKPIGVTGLTLALPLALVVFIVEARGQSRRAALAATLSLVALTVTMVLAWQNELGVAPGPVLGVRSLVAVHGVVNTLIVVPAFMLATRWLGDDVR